MERVASHQGQHRRKARTKTFTGCWTCRERKVKCDEASPECGNCTRRGRECKGYGRRLCWTSGRDGGEVRNPDNIQGSRRYAGGPLPDLPDLSGRDLRREITTIASGHEKPGSLFGAFDSTAYSATDDMVAQSPISLGPIENSPPICNEEHETLLGADTLQTPETPNVSSQRLYQFEPALEPIAPLVSEEAGERDFDARSDRTQWVLSPESSKSSAGDDADSGDNVCPAINLTHDLKRRLVSGYPFTLSPIIRLGPPQLHQPCNNAIHHYATRLAYYMMPVEVPQDQNPWLDIYLVRAVSTYEARRSGNALFHSLVSAACFHQSQLVNSEEHERAGEFHQQEAFRDLRTSLGTLQSGDEYTDDIISILACVLMMTTIEAMRGTSGGWMLHLDGGLKLLRNVEVHSGSYEQKKSIRVLCQIHDCLRTLMGTLASQSHQHLTNWDEATAEDLPSMSDTFGSVAWIDDEFYCLDRTYGISIDTLTGLKRINALARQLCQQELDSMEVIEQEMEELSATLNMVLSSHPATTRTSTSATQHLKMGTVSSPFAQEVMQNHCWAFHLAAILYFNRVARMLRPTTASVQQWLVGEALNHIETIVAISGDDARPITLWPLLVVGCEATVPPLRRRVILLFARMHRFGIGNVRTAKLVILEVWRRADREILERSGLPDSRGPGTSDSHKFPDPEAYITNIDWRDVMTEMAADIVMA